MDDWFRIATEQAGGPGHEVGIILCNLTGTDGASTVPPKLDVQRLARHAKRAVSLAVSPQNPANLRVSMNVFIGVAVAIQPLRRFGW